MGNSIDQTSECPSASLLARYAAGELDEQLCDRVSEHLQECTDCRQLHEVLEMQQRVFAEKYPADRHLGGLLVRARQKQNQRQHRKRLHVALATSAAALAVFVAVWLLEEPASVRLKGAAQQHVSLSALLLREGHIRRASSGEVFSAGDRLQFVYGCTDCKWIMLVSVDDAGNVSNFNPDGAGSSVPASPGEQNVLPAAVELDDSAVSERVFAIFSDRPLEYEKVRQKAIEAWRRLKQSGGSIRSLEKLPLPYPQASFLLEKKP